MAKKKYKSTKRHLYTGGGAMSVTSQYSSLGNKYRAQGLYPAGTNSLNVNSGGSTSGSTNGGSKGGTKSGSKGGSDEDAGGGSFMGNVGQIAGFANMFDSIAQNVTVGIDSNRAGVNNQPQVLVEGVLGGQSGSHLGNMWNTGAKTAEAINYVNQQGSVDFAGSSTEDLLAQHSGVGTMNRLNIDTKAKEWEDFAFDPASYVLTRWVFKNREKASDRQKRINEAIDAVNTRQQQAYSDAVRDFENRVDRQIAMNYRAFGGPLDDFATFGGGALGYDVAKDNIIAKQMANQDKMKNSFSYIPTYADGGPTKVHSLVFPRMNEAGEEVTQLEQQARIEAEKARQAKREAAKQARRAQFNRVVNDVKGIFSPTTTTVTTPGEIRTTPKSIVFPALNQPVYTDNYLAYGGLLSDNFTNGVTEINAGGTHEGNPNMGVPMGMAPDGQPNLVEEGETVYKDYVFSNRLRVPEAIRKKYKLRGPKDMTYSEAFKKAEEESKERENDPISKNGLDNIAMVLAESQEQVRAEKASRQKAKGGHLFSGEEVGGPYDEPGVWYTEDGMEVVLPAATVTPNKKRRFGSWWGDNAPSLARLAEPFANAAAVWTDTLGVTNKPTHFNYIPDYRATAYTPLGNYAPEAHFDINYAANQAAQQAAATKNAIMNTTAPNRYATLLAADYNAQVADGELRRKASMDAYDNLLKTLTFNRATDQYNSEMAIKAATEDAQQRLAYANAKLAEARYNEDNSNAAWGARAKNIGNLATSIANIGREQDALNWRDMLIRSGVFGTLSEKPSDWSDKKWQAYQDALTMTAYGGKLKKKKRGLTY